MTSEIIFSPFLPLWAIALFAIAGTGLVIAGLFARASGALLRALVFLLLLAALANPAINREKRDPLSDIAVLVIDRSASQKTGNRMARTDQAVKALRADIARLPGLELRTVTVTSGLTSQNDGTRAFAALKQALGDIPPERFAGAIFVTDGQIHDIPEPGKPLGFKGPLHGLITGRSDETDRRIVVEAAPKFAIVGQEQTIRFKVTQRGPGQTGKMALVTISIDGKVRRQIPVRVGQPVNIPVVITHGGQNITELSVNTLKGELSARNNHAVIVTRGVRDRLRVLLVSGKPHPGERTWRNLLKADASVDLVHFTILRPPEKQDGTPINELSLIAFPTRELFSEKLNQFDLVIFDRYARRGVLPSLYLFNIADYVNRGGAVLVAAGPDYAGPTSIYHSPLADILPAAPTGDITTQPFRPMLTQKGARHPVTRDLPGGATSNPSWGRWFRLIDANRNSGASLMNGPDGKPLLVVARKQKGRIAQLLSDHSWLWARGYDGGGPQAELLRRMAHWLMKEPDLEEEALSATQRGEQLIIRRQTMATTAGDVSVTSPSGEKATIKLTRKSPGLWQAAVDIKEPGLHRLADGQLTAWAAAGNADAREAGDILSTTALFAPVAKATGGASVRIENAIPRVAHVKPGRAMSGSGWIGLTRNGVYQVTSITRISLFTTLAALAALLAAICAMWYREGR
ncbi:MAG TPA: hypothetical protein ENJ99_04070 [Rhizobiales bacterium]|nr:hypothetical protein [Hyphomicrobiales bacterium]